MALKKYNTDVEVKGEVTANGVKTPTGTSTQTFLADGQVVEIDSWETLEW